MSLPVWQWEADADRPATLAEADRHYAAQLGAERPEQAWILSDRDVWYPNPSYHGPAVRHPEDWSENDDDQYVAIPHNPTPRPVQGFEDDDVPF